MATITAQILIGQKHPYDSGITNFSHSLFLSESSRPAWILTPTKDFKDQKAKPKITWIPTLENMLEDALVMIGIYVLKDRKLLSLAKEFFRNPKNDFIELYDDIKPEELQELYSQARLIEGRHKTMVTVFEGSTIVNQLPVLEKYENDIEVCRSVYIKEFSPWSREFETRGGMGCFE